MSLNETIGNLSKIADFTEETGRVNVLFKVISMKEPRIVTSKQTGRKHLVSDILVADETAKILLTLWNDDIDLVEEGRSYILRKGRVQVYDYSMRLAKGLGGEFIRVQDLQEEPALHLDMSKPFMGRKKKRRRTLSGEGRTFHGTPGRNVRGYCSEKEF
ncbi:MAG: hypothetical protein ACFFED_16760 [Candidatus Thorarchaeota archaeon]